MSKYLVTLIAFFAAVSVHAADETTPANVDWLFVQNADAVTLEDGVLTLKGISPVTLYFSDRPERITAHGSTSEFITYWGKGGGKDGFAKNPPNATLSIVSKAAVDDIVVTLKNPRLNGDTLQYDVAVLDGDARVEGGPCSLFVDVIGMPLTPVSYAGVARRSVRRMVYR
jgi:hypothetical protein